MANVLQLKEIMKVGPHFLSFLISEIDIRTASVTHVGREKLISQIDGNDFSFNVNH